MISRRHALLTGLASATTLGAPAFARRATEIQWEDLIPPGVPYSEIIAEGELDTVADTWQPVFDENGTKVNEDLNGKFIKMPGFLIPLDQTTNGVSEYLLVPYVGACIHTPPPPPNQLVFATTNIEWNADNLWDAVWVTGVMSTDLLTTTLGETGYALNMHHIEIYEW